jgi:hypothetical protein
MSWHRVGHLMARNSAVVSTRFIARICCTFRLGRRAPR